MVVWECISQINAKATDGLRSADIN